MAYTFSASTVTRPAYVLESTSTRGVMKGSRGRTIRYRPGNGAPGVAGTSIRTSGIADVSFAAASDDGMD